MRHDALTHEVESTQIVILSLTLKLQASLLEYADGKSLQWEMGWGRGCAQGGGRCGIFLK